LADIRRGLCVLHSSAIWIAERLMRPEGPNVRLVPWQFTPISPRWARAKTVLGAKSCGSTPHGEISGGAGAFARWLQFRGNPYAILGRLMEAG
jgi:hypothetical protein